MSAAAMAVMHEEMHQHTGEHKQQGQVAKHMGAMLGEEQEGCNEEETDRYESSPRPQEAEGRPSADPIAIVAPGRGRMGRVLVRGHGGLSFMGRSGPCLRRGHGPVHISPIIGMGMRS
jgi:hypothetical protein